jgi:hypothetical protein
MTSKLNHSTLAQDLEKTTNQIKQISHRITELEKMIIEEKMTFELKKPEIRKEAWQKVSNSNHTGLGITLPKVENLNITNNDFHSILEKTYHIQA